MDSNSVIDTHQQLPEWVSYFDKRFLSKLDLNKRGHQYFHDTYNSCVDLREDFQNNFLPYLESDLGFPSSPAIYKYENFFRSQNIPEYELSKKYYYDENINLLKKNNSNSNTYNGGNSNKNLAKNYVKKKINKLNDNNNINDYKKKENKEEKKDELKNKNVIKNYNPKNNENNSSIKKEKEIKTTNQSNINRINKIYNKNIIPIKEESYELVSNDKGEDIKDYSIDNFQKAQRNPNQNKINTKVQNKIINKSTNNSELTYNNNNQVITSTCDTKNLNKIKSGNNTEDSNSSNKRNSIKNYLMIKNKNLPEEVKNRDEENPKLKVINNKNHSRINNYLSKRKNDEKH